MNKHIENVTAGIQSLLPADFFTVERQLKDLSDRVNGLQNALPKRALAAIPSLDGARRDALKLSLELESLETQYDEALGLEIVDMRMHDQLREVGDVRKMIAAQYVLCDELTDAVKKTVKSVKDKVTDELLESLNILEDELKIVSKAIQAMLFNTPELGMTFNEWNGLSASQRRGLRSPGRPKAPLEALIIKTKRDLLDCVALANRLSDGKIRSVEDAVRGISLDNRGRPPVSDLGKMDRKLGALLRKYEDVCRIPSKMQELKKVRLKAQISALKQEIAEEESMLEGVAVFKRQLEKLRANHRDMVVAEVSATGSDQAALLLAIIRNETEQLSVIDKIRELEPDARITVTHKVNPKETRSRFERLRMNGQLDEPLMHEINQMERKLESYSFSRNR